MSETLVNGGYGVETEQPAVKSLGGLVRVRVHLQGVTPLLMNAMGQEQLLDLWGKKKPARTAARPEPREAAESKLHLLPDGRPCVPVRALYASFINAGQFVRLDGKRQISTEKKTILPGMLTLEDIELPILRPDGKPPTWETDIQLGKNPNGGEAVCLIRPRFDVWQLECTVEVDQETMPLKMARELIDLAGRRIGLLEFRPQRKGTFGRFVVSYWKVLTR